MRKAEKIVRIRSELDRLYPTVPIPLRHVDAYTLLIAVLLSAQSTDKKVNEITPALFTRAGTPDAMVALGVPTILEHVRAIGLAPTKSRNIHRLSQILVERHGSEVPRTFDELEALPGVGHKTASVVMSQAFGVPAFPVDTHIHRLAWRWGLSNGKNVGQTEKDLKRIFPSERWNLAHLQIIMFGREHCPARGHVPERCAICSFAGVKKRLAEEARRTRRR